ncbi:uncharacterized protein [Rutidosis leptorrhynchoides]|uniref:uncharacterized protein n=1 Tax=Rutidosis leptorrhynchoides TaxID=125765 RepID=UPI003A994F37
MVVESNKYEEGSVKGDDLSYASECSSSEEDVSIADHLKEYDGIDIEPFVNGLAKQVPEDIGGTKFDSVSMGEGSVSTKPIAGSPKKYFGSSTSKSHPPRFSHDHVNESINHIPSSRVNCYTHLVVINHESSLNSSIEHSDDIFGIGELLGLNLKESKMPKLLMSRLRSFWGNDNFDFAISLARGFSGGIISIWEPSMFIRNEIWCDVNFVIVKGTWVWENIMVFMINVYAPQDLIDKVEVWNKLSSFMEAHPGEYIFMGDWNSVRTSDERCRLVFCHLDVRVFNEFIDQNVLFDMPLGGLQFTWRNKPGNKFSKIDRFLLSHNVVKVVDDLKGLVLSRGHSDHSPLLLFQDKVDFGPTYFKIFDSWFDRPDFDEVVKNAWNTINIDNNNQAKRLKEIKDKIEELDIIIDSGNASNNDISLRNSLSIERDDISKLINLDFLQKAIIKCDVEGEENSKFFHNTLKHKRCCQHIQGVLVNGVWYDHPNDIKNRFVVHFESKFRLHDSELELCQLRPQSRLSAEDADVIERNVDDEEIKVAVWNCGSSKAPGPDGILFRFLKHFWDLFKFDFCRDIRSFFSSGIMPRRANSVFFC